MSAGWYPFDREADPHDALGGRDRQPRMTSPRFWLSVIAAAVFGGIAAGVGMWMMRPAGSAPHSRLTHVLPAGQSFSAGWHPMLAVAPDGSSVVYVANERLYLRPIDEFEARPIRGSEGQPSPTGSISTPFFSPDGRSVGYWDGGDEAIKRVDVGGGTPIVLARTQWIRGATWGATGSFSTVPRTVSGAFLPPAVNRIA